IEYYVGWGVVEPNRDRWDWNQTQLDAQAIKARGMKFIPFGWVQNLPTWVRNDPSYPRATDVDNGLETDSLSIYAPETKAAYDRFYSNLKTNLGTYVDELRLGSPYDYGECAYPNGAGQDVFPLKNAASGFWVGETVARDDFRAAMQTKYGSLANLNAAWGTAFTDFSALPYPTDTTHRRYWLDFIDWYYTGNTRKMGELVDVVRGYFPTTPLNINLGWPFEKLNLGQDISGFAQLAAQKGIYLRRGTGKGVPFLSSKRASTALRFYGGQLLGSEPDANSETVSSLATTFFKDLSDGVNWHFDYAGNLKTGAAVFSQFLQIGSSVSGHQARIDTAVFFPTTSHRLDDWGSWRQPGLSGGYPGNLQPFCDQVRDVLDYGVIDERMIGDGALNQYKILAWPVGTVAEAQTMAAISAWVQNGGVLLALDFTSIADVDGNPGAFAALSALPKVGDMRVAGQGLIFDAAGNQQKLMQWIAQRGNMKPLNANYPTQISTLPVIDNASDGVLTTEFTNGVLLFNSTSSMVTVTLPPLDGQGTAQQIAVPSLGLSWVDRITQLPTITLFTPASAPVGATVTITGTNLTGVTAVKFNGIAANIISNTANQIVVAVPTGATSGAISVTISGGTATSTIVYTVLPTPPGTTPASVSAVSNAASYFSGFVAPGEIVLIQGSGLGPAQLTQFQVDSSGNIGTQLAGTTVSFNGMLAPIIYTSATAVAAIVPYEISSASTQVAVTYKVGLRQQRRSTWDNPLLVSSPLMQLGKAKRPRLTRMAP
ncbi:MAG: IPT/TIG domain-containing protein, partial [Bryobacteraceae bacterium]